MSVGTRLVASIAVVLVPALGGLAAVVSTLSVGQAQEDGLVRRRAGRGPGRSGRGGHHPPGRTAETLSQTLGAAVVDLRGDRALDDEVQCRLLAADPSLPGRPVPGPAFRD